MLPKTQPNAAPEKGSWDAIDEASAESFPASDPPAHRIEKAPPQPAGLPPAGVPSPSSSSKGRS